LPDHCFRSSASGLTRTKGTWRSLASAALTVCFIAGLVLNVPAQKAPKPDRKVLASPKPQYPEPLKHAQIGGLVRLRATVLPNGTVSYVGVLGGNPILAQSAVDAIKRWKFAPGASQTLEDISVNFNPHAD
jgi:TonB family protein